jgi:hypothetical protein
MSSRRQRLAIDPNTPINQLQTLVKQLPALVAENPVLPLLALEDAESGTRLWHEAHRRTLIAGLRQKHREISSPVWFSLLAESAERLVELARRVGASPLALRCFSSLAEGKRACIQGNNIPFQSAKDLFEKTTRAKSPLFHLGTLPNPALGALRNAFLHCGPDALRCASLVHGYCEGPVDSISYRAAALRELERCVEQLRAREES